MLNISFCVIAKNEEKTLPNLIKSLGQFKGEIVVLDTGSTDNTVDIARKLGATVYEARDQFRVSVSESDLVKMNAVTKLSPIMKIDKEPFVAGDSYFNFSAARNYAVQLCKYDIIVTPDCDEVFESVDWDSIAQYFAQGARMLINDIIHTSENIDFIIDKTCIFDRRFYTCEYGVHEIWTPHDNRMAPIKVAQSVALLRHRKEIHKARPYNLALLHSYALNPTVWHYVYHFARDLAHNQYYRINETDNFLDAMAILKPLIHSIENATTPIYELNYYDCYSMLIYVLGVLKYHQKTKEYCFRSLCYAGLRAETYLQLAEIYQNEHLYFESIIQIEAAINCIRVTNLDAISAKIPFLYREHPYKLLYKANYLIGDHIKAKLAFEKLLTFAPTNINKINVHVAFDNKLCVFHATHLIKSLRKDYPDAIVSNIIVGFDKCDPFARLSFIVGAHLLDTSTIAFYPNSVIYNYLNPGYFSKNSSYSFLLNKFAVKNSSSDKLDLSLQTLKLIVFDCGENVVWDPAKAHVNASGAEIMTSELAKQFVNLNFQVVVFGRFEAEGTFENVIYMNHEKYLPFLEENHVHYLIVSRYPQNIVYRDTVDNVFLWLHDTVPVHKSSPKNSSNNLPTIHIDTSKFRGIICLSEWHKEMILQYYPGIESQTKVLVSRNAIDITKFNYTLSKVPFRFVYTSYANRGLDMLLKIMPRIRERYPQTELHIYCRDDNLLSKCARNIIATSKDYIQRFDRVNQIALAKVYLEADVWLYPTTSTETYCITALEAQAARCLCVSTRISALETTIGNRGILIDIPDSGVSFEDRILQKLFFVLDRPELKEALIKKGHEFALAQTFESLAQEWIKHYF